MNILISNEANNLRRCIPLHSVAYIDFIDQAARLQLNQHIDGQVTFFIVGNSARRLAHAIEQNAAVAYLGESQFLNERQFKEWQKQSQTELAGLLEAGELVEVA